MVTENKLVPKNLFCEICQKKEFFGLKRTIEAALLGDWLFKQLLHVAVTDNVLFTFALWKLPFHSEKNHDMTKLSDNHSSKYSIVKDSNADLGVIFRFLQNPPITKAVCIKISKTFFCIFGNILIFLRENKEA